MFHAHDWLSLDSARELKYEYQLPMVATVHATEWGRNNGVHTGLSKYIHEQEYWLTYEAWRVIVCSEFMKDEVAHYFSCPNDKVDVVYNGVDAEKFEFEATPTEITGWRARLADPDQKIVLFVGRFVREKGIHLLLNAASSILAEAPDTKFVIVGGGDRANLERFVRWFGLAENVLFTGFMSGRALHQLYRAADVAVFPSLYEPFGIDALEAMAADCPVVASDAGGLKEVVKHDQTGTSFFSGDYGSLTWAVLRVLQDPDRAGRLKSAAKSRLKTDFNWVNIAQQTLDTYERVWGEFVDSYWADRSLWPVKPGAEERAAKVGVSGKAKTGSYVVRATQDEAIVSMPIDADDAIAAGESEREEKV